MGPPDAIGRTAFSRAAYLVNVSSITDQVLIAWSHQQFLPKAFDVCMFVALDSAEPVSLLYFTHNRVTKIPFPCKV